MADKAADAGKKAGKKNGKLLYGIVGVLVLAGAGGYWYTRPAAETQQDAKCGLLVTPETGKFRVVTPH